jgi:fluoroacetyl-CoA thioesterase
MSPPAGRTASFSYVVTAADTAAALGSGDVAVLGTPRVLALMEQATVAAVAGDLDPAQTTVGVSVELDHSRVTVVGAVVEVTAVLDEVSGRRLAFDTRVSDAAGTAASGRITRALVDRSRFPGA